MENIIIIDSLQAFRSYLNNFDYIDDSDIINY